MSSSSSTLISLSSHRLFLSIFSDLLPVVSTTSHKGQAGKLLVMGGSAAYTGAPYFAAMSALKLGADLSTVVCSVEAGTAIKSYSPELMVRPLLVPSHLMKSTVSSFTGPDQTEQKLIQQVADEVLSLTERSSSIVIGPGLGKDDHMINKTFNSIFAGLLAQEHCPPLVIDGDAITLLAENPSLLTHISTSKNPPLIIITPNAAEFRRLWKSFIPDREEPPISLPTSDRIEKLMKSAHNQSGSNFTSPELVCSDELAHHTAELACAMKHVTLVRKGTIDIISDGHRVLYCAEPGAPKRCGGQGDFLAGTTGTLLYWATQHEKKPAEAHKHDSSAAVNNVSPTLRAAYCASFLTRRCGLSAFLSHGRSLIAHNLLDELETVLEQIAPIKNKFGQKPIQAGKL